MPKLASNIYTTHAHLSPHLEAMTTIKILFFVLLPRYKSQTTNFQLPYVSSNHWRISYMPLFLYNTVVSALTLHSHLVLQQYTRVHIHSVLLTVDHLDAVLLLSNFGLGLFLHLRAHATFSFPHRYVKACHIAVFIIHFPLLCCHLGTSLFQNLWEKMTRNRAFYFLVPSLD